jgi:hypothetical protein
VQPEWLTGLFHYLFLNNHSFSVIFLVSIYAKEHIISLQKVCGFVPYSCSQ